MKDRTAPPAADNAALDTMRFRADPWADATIAKILGGSALSAQPSDNADAAAVMAHWQPRCDKLTTVNQVFAAWTDNAAILRWRAAGSGLPDDIGNALEAYLQAAAVRPDWFDAEKIARAEQLFMDHGALSVTLLFCASLPQCYVVPDLSAVLQITGQLDNNAEHRVRATGAMIFPVMMNDGLAYDQGAGLAQIFKVRLIHATIRHLILRKSPETVMAESGRIGRTNTNSDVIAPLAEIAKSDSMNRALLAGGWNTPDRGLPCNQEELAYTLLTFSYVFLEGLRKLGIGLPQADEEAYLHTWNVVGYYLGIDATLMAHTMDDAARLFAAMQARGRAGQLSKPITPDPRPSLGNALMHAMKTIIPWTIAKPFPVLMTRYLCGNATALDLGLNGAVWWSSKALFYLLMLIAKSIDATVRRTFPQFSTCRFITRLLGYQLITRLLMSETRPLKLPEHESVRMNNLLNQWGRDQLAPAWMNKLEGMMTTKDGWGSENKR